MKKNKIFKRVLTVIGLMIILLSMSVAFIIETNTWGLTYFSLLQQSLPHIDKIKEDYENEYMIDNINNFENQGKNQCAGYTSAFVLRHFGKEVTGEQIYNSLNYKLTTGYILPQGIIEYFQKENFNIKLYRSDISKLKARVSKGNPIIILMGDGANWQHYATVVGYDNENIYLYDSLKSNVSDSQYYNRIMSEKQFLEYWNNGIPIFNKICFEISEIE